MGPRQRRLRVAHQVMGALACIAIGLGAQAAGVLDGVERRAIDTRFDVRGARTPPRNVLLVLIDDVTFSDLGQQWPFQGVAAAGGPPARRAPR